MRYVFIGASNLAVATAHLLADRGHEVIVIERDKAVIDDLAEHLDCGFLHADGSKPAVLAEVNAADVDMLFCLTSSDQANIIASLVGRSLGFRKVVTRIEDEEYEHICIELGLEKSIVPARTIGRYLADSAEGQSTAELGTMIKGDARLLSFVVGDEHPRQVGDLELPREARVICVYREAELLWPNPELKLERGDEVVVITLFKYIKALRERYVQPNIG
jgi:trk system potassium uptake protein TrkA